MFPSTAAERRGVIAWSLISGLIHMVWEASWSLVAPILTVPEHQEGAWQFWTLYGLADARYLHADPFVRILELWTGTFVAGLNFFCVYTFWRRRHLDAGALVLLLVSALEIDGTIFYFGSEMFAGWRDLDTSSFVFTWVLFFGLNFVWIMIPGWLIYRVIAEWFGLRVGGKVERAPVALVGGGGE